MKPSELRIGNLVKYSDGSFFKVVGIHEFGLDVEDNIETIYMEYEEFEPIPLTEEWLLKLGFEKAMTWTYVIDLSGNLKLVYYFGEKGWSIGFSNCADFTNLKHVHQLQNLYFALTGEELTINL